MSDLMTIKEAAGYLRMNPLTVYRLASKGKMPATKVGRHWRVHQEALEEWLHPEFPRWIPALLVVDDEEAIGRLFEKTTEGDDVRLVVTSGGEEALIAMEESEFDLVFLDLRMPGMDGVETFRHIRESDSQVPVVIITGYPDSNLMAHALEIGPIGVMMKPFGPSDIQQVIDTFVRRPAARGRSSRPAGSLAV